MAAPLILRKDDFFASAEQAVAVADRYPQNVFAEHTHEFYELVLVRFSIPHAPALKATDQVRRRGGDSTARQPWWQDLFYASVRVVVGRCAVRSGDVVCEGLRSMCGVWFALRICRPVAAFWRS